MMDNIVSYVKGKVDMYEIFFNESDILNIEADGKKANFVSQGNINGFALRVVIGKKIGFASTLNLNNYKECVDNAIKIAKLNNVDKDFKNFALPEKYKKIKNYSNELIDFDAEGFFKLNKEIVDEVCKLNEDIEITRIIYYKGINNKRIINSNGINFGDKVASNSFVYELKLGNEAVDLHDSNNSVLTTRNVKENVERLESLYNKRRIKGAEIPIIFHQNAFSEFLDNSFEFNINAENVQNGKSLFKNKVGEKIFDKRISIRDNGLQKGLINSRSFDDEGIPSRKTDIIKNGVLKGFIYDIYSANKEGKKSTGNAIRATNFIPKISTTNLIFNKGNKTKEQLIRSIDKGLYINSLLGGHTMNEATGDFSFVVSEGQYIEKGEIKYPVKDVMIAGNFYKMLNNIDSIGKGVKHYGSGYYLPLILFSKVNIIG